MTGAAISDGAHTLFVADFSDTDAAWEAYGALKAIEDGATFAVDSVVVVKRDEDGKLEVQKAPMTAPRRASSGEWWAGLSSG